MWATDREKPIQTVDDLLAALEAPAHGPREVYRMRCPDRYLISFGGFGPVSESILQEALTLKLIECVRSPQNLEVWRLSKAPQGDRRHDG
jgi:hypothetical protein